MMERIALQAAGKLVVAVGAIALLHGSAHALTSCNGGVTFTSDTTLADDYQLTGNGTCITVSNGAKLELDGHTITCNGCGASAVAVRLSAGGKLYGKTSSSSASPGAILATAGSYWNTAVTGTYGSPADLVKDLKVNAAAYGVVNVKDVTNSVFESCSYTTIQDNIVGAGRSTSVNAITHSTSGGGTTTITGNLCTETATDCPHPNPPFLLP